MKKFMRHFFLWLFIIGMSLFGVYLYGYWALRSDRYLHYPTDVQLSISLLLLFVLVVNAIGLSIDLIVRIYTKQRYITTLDAALILTLLIPVVYLACLTLFQNNCACDFVIMTFNTLF